MTVHEKTEKYSKENKGREMTSKHKVDEDILKEVDRNFDLQLWIVQEVRKAARVPFVCEELSAGRIAIISKSETRKAIVYKRGYIDLLGKSTKEQTRLLCGLHLDTSEKWNRGVILSTVLFLNGIVPPTGYFFGEPSPSKPDSEPKVPFTIKPLEGSGLGTAIEKQYLEDFRQMCVGMMIPPRYVNKELADKLKEQDKDD